MQSAEAARRTFLGSLTSAVAGGLWLSPNAAAAGTKRWEALESMPVSFYGKFGAEPLAERTRSVAAHFLGCDLDEMVVTTSTTNGMNAVAEGFCLKPGDRILTTNHEHSGGLLCWKYFEKYYGAVIATVSLAPEEHDTEITCGS
jgi:selenocysteine lyase/cysteine desulfurase